ncbi:membrane protein insertase, YidC/Oxa1 family, C-terminal domain-containing protein [Ruminococcaceae bacterium YRB3002]|nr:membrane protein insertase, YidC/Oxa1 family, C-terminal domain-containing protein [Ruminococcaceae bacterium YRB3002]
MSILDIFIKPLEFVYEFIYSVASRISDNPLVCILILSITVNFLALPLYRRADIIQQESRDTENRLRPVIDHIKKTFKGDEKVMMLQTYYRLQSYSPLSSMKSIISLVLQIPFFIAAYRFLSHLPLLAGVSVGPISNLNAPDGLITIGSVTINLLPILMTVINIISSEIYTKGQPFKSKIVLYLSAAIFLVLLYDSPSGLVFYWTFNNVFSLIKNIVMSLFISDEKKSSNEKQCVFVDVFGLSLLFLFVFTSVLIPSAIVAASPSEFINRLVFDNPLRYVFYSALIGIGMYVFWPMIYYGLMSGYVKKAMNYIVLTLAVGAVINYMAFSPVNLRLSSVLTILSHHEFSITKGFINLAILIVTSVGIIMLYRRFPSIVKGTIITGLFATIVMSGYNIYSINASVNAFKNSGVREIDLISKEETSENENSQIIRLSTKGKNVVIIMLDRAVGGMVPFIFEEKKELYGFFDGFTYYSNTISFGDHTKTGSPSLFGGYEYTPAQMNKRESEALASKHNEALLVLPILFSHEGFYSSVIDLPYVNYSEVTDMSLFNNYDTIDAFSVDGALNSYFEESSQLETTTRNRNFIVHSVFRVVPMFLQDAIYDNGNYHSVGIQYNSNTDLDVIVSPQIPYDMSSAMGVSQEFMNSYTALNEMKRITDICDDQRGGFVVMDNNTTHEANILQEPEYIPAPRINNNAYDLSHASRFNLNGRDMTVDNYDSMALYHVNVASYLALGRWFDYLREQGVWDNTRIILVSDHGFAMGQFDVLKNDSLGMDFEAYNALLMVKDFDSEGFRISDEFMTNADVPTLALEGIIDNPKNPFTGNTISSVDKDNGDVMILNQYSYSDRLNSGNTFSPGRWFTAHDNIWDSNNWKLVRED